MDDNNLYDHVVIKPASDDTKTDLNSSPKRTKEIKGSTVTKKSSPEKKSDFKVESPKNTAKEKKTVNFSVTEKAEDPEKKALENFDNLIEKSQTVLFHTKSVFPFDFFPDEITIDKKKVTIKFSQFFWTGYTQTVMIDDLFSVELGSSPFFSTLILRFRMGTEEARIGTLWPKEAERAKSILQGLVVAKKERINLTEVNEQKLSKKLEEVGATGELA